MTDKQLADAEARQAAATPGPWEISGTFVRTTYIDEGKLPERQRHYTVCEIIGDYGVAEADAEFIAHSREDLALALDEIKHRKAINNRQTNVYDYFTVQVANADGKVQSLLYVTTEIVDWKLFPRHWRQACEAASVTGDDGDINVIINIMERKGWSISDPPFMTVTI